MKGKLYVGGIIAIIFVLFASTVMFFDKKIEAYAASAVFVDQPFNAYFSGEIKEGSLTDGSVYVVDKGTGKKVDATLLLSGSNNSVIISGLKVGSYTLHVEKNAFKKISVRNSNKTVEFTVVDEIKQLTSEQDLKTYFETVLNFENERYGNAQTESNFSNSAKEESVAMDSASGGTGSSRHSTTNNQVEDIEEGDIVVTDGRYIYSIGDNQLIITDASNPKNMKVVSKKTFKENAYPTKLMLHGKLLIVAYDSYEERPIKGKDYMQHLALSKFAFYNVSNVKDPQLVREIGQEGMLAGVRKHGDVLYMVTNTTPNYWLMREKVDVELRPFIFDSNEQNTSEPMPIEKITIFPGSSEPNYTILSAIDLKDFAKNEVKTESYLGSGSQLYMSPKAIYVTSPKYDYTAPASTKRMLIDWMPSIVNTQIYKFSINKTAIKMTAETTVKGTILNQFSMDEYDGHFRVATTEGNAWGNDANSKNHLFILDKNLNQVGSLNDLARGERIYSARFMGDKAYIVTFKQVDPLFVIDVANPANPKVLGELKIPGFSNYLHPLDDNHLIGIGYDTQVRIDSYSKEPFVITKGMKLALFDVSDLANPKEKDAVIIGGRGTYSDVQYDHKALFRDEENHYYGFPITIYADKGEYDAVYKGTGSQVYEVTTEGIKLKADLVTLAKAGEQYEQWEKVVRRMIYINDALYTVAQGEIVSYDLKTFKKLDAISLQYKVEKN
ncbi:beta-propeller domain-containing protein [Solibacillus sp. CAU 1738]|uniref:beta-propeller domain-containing protein n=1 Tax=Solibacillus sp. CAU 1738 TaxID=3140363 RepID=UPI00326188D8